MQNITAAVISEAGATDAYSTALAIEDFIINGNATTEFKRNTTVQELSVLSMSTQRSEALKEVRAEFNTAFVTMARMQACRLDR